MNRQNLLDQKDVFNQKLLLNRREFVGKGTFGLLSFIVAGKMLLLTPAQARAERVSLQYFNAEQAAALDRLGDIIVPGAARSGLSHFVDRHLSMTNEQCMLIIRYLGVEAPYNNFYAQSLIALDASSQALYKKTFASLSVQQAHSLVDIMAKNNPQGWQGPPAPFFFFVLRNDACDVVYGTEQGFKNIGVPYRAHIKPPTPW